MMSIKEMLRLVADKFSPRARLAAMMALVASLLPSAAFASEGDVVLKFTDADRNYLYLSLLFGATALVTAGYLIKSVLAQSPGSAKMQEVGQAIKEGALAYLRKQVGTMAIFVVILAIGLYALYNGPFVPIAFVLGVAASYIAGYTGMVMAVNGNMRTANAALTSYKKTLEVAFRSGAVAGLVTVGMGLIGATLIFLFAGAQAMKMLVGFGFGGSLAALFMRVGGGIFTKAADVGADLVGKVEAGIPEDDPRNPAVIADNVGDNVGDCAGMAADVFESYEVTLVAAIVLGAATAAVFDESTWMRLIMFALMARGIGILASIFGIFSVKGSDDVDTDPLMNIRKGFYASAFLALILTAGLAWGIMGGNPKWAAPISALRLDSVRNITVGIIQDVRGEQAKVATETSKKSYEVAVKDLITRPALEKYHFKDDPNDTRELQDYLALDPESVPHMDLNGYHKADFNDKENENKYLDYSVPNSGPDAQTTPFVSIRKFYTDHKYVLAKLKIDANIVMANPNAKPGDTTPPQTREIHREVWLGPVTDDDVKNQIESAKKQAAAGSKIDVVQTESDPVDLYVNKDGKMVLAYEKGPDRPNVLNQQGTAPLGFYKSDADTMNKLVKNTAAQGLPDRDTIELAQAKFKVVPWYMFFGAIAFGILMAFAIEFLTDYYVSTHKKPVQEVAGVSSAGPAPMIIQGFAYAAESSVFMVFAIVIALIAPTLFFPPAEYGTLILSYFGVALVGLGLLTTTGFVLAMDTFGPISDNAQGVYEMSGEGHDNAYGSKAVQRLDAAGNTTKALTKGFAIATAVVAAVALFHSYLEDARLNQIGLRLDIPEIFLGLLIGGAAPYLFSSSTINAVGRAAFFLINEVRRQFREDPGIMAGTSKPDYARCVSIVTAAAQAELIGPAILAIGLPMAVAFGFSIGKPVTIINGQPYNLVGAQALGGFLAGAILSGQLMAVLLANSGGMWDNAKKLIEDGMYGGKGSDAHKAAIVCDTVGDPFKDTAGPAMNPLIKVMNLVALLLAPIIIKPFGTSVLVTVTLVCVAALAFSIWWSKRTSMGSNMMVHAEGAETALMGADPTVVISEPQAAPAKKKLKVDDDDKDA